MQELQFEKFAIEEEGLFVSDYKIWDDKRKLVAEAKGEIFSRAKEVSFYKENSKEIESTYRIIKQGILKPEYQVVKDGVIELVLSKHLSLFDKSFSIETRNHSTMTLTGNLWKSDYVIHHENIEIAKISRQSSLFSKDTYGTAVHTSFDPKLALCVIIILDIIIDIDRQRKN